MRFAFAIMMLSGLLGACMSGEPSGPQDPSTRESGACIIGGCAAEVCADYPAISTCIWREVDACYQTALCGRQPDGTCGWTPTAELTACVAAHPS
jgi:hypothetical protein